MKLEFLCFIAGGVASFIKLCLAVPGSGKGERSTHKEGDWTESGVRFEESLCCVVCVDYMCLCLCL